MAHYIFSEAAAFKGWEDADPQVVGDALELIATKNGGRLIPGEVVKDAKKPTHPLHPYFEWDNKQAADLYRIEQARFLIRSVRIVSADKDDEPRHAYLSISDKGGAAYHHHDQVITSRELQLAVLRQAERDLLAWERRYRDIVDICAMVRQARELVAARVNEQESRPQ